MTVATEKKPNTLAQFQRECRALRDALEHQHVSASSPSINVEHAAWRVLSYSPHGYSVIGRMVVEALRSADLSPSTESA